MVFVIHLIHFLFLLCFLYSFMVIFRSFTLFKSDCPGRAVRKTVTKTVAEILPDQLRFPVYDINGSFMARFCALVGE